MIRPRMHLLVVGHGGAAPLRLAIPHWSLALLLLATMIAGFTLGLMLVANFQLEPQALLSLQLRQENKALQQRLITLEAEMQTLQDTHLASENMFIQLWVRSGLNTQGTQTTIEDEEIMRLRTAATSYLLGDLPSPRLIEKLRHITHQSASIQKLMVEILEYFHDAAQLLASTPSIRPTLSRWITSQFGKRRHPIFHTMMMHKGLDLGGPLGTPVFAPADGVVIWTGWRGGYGQTVVLDHGAGLQTHFAHLSKYLVKTGNKVARGTVIAKIGSTGKSTGPHLHYEVRRFGEPLDPGHFILN